MKCPYCDNEELTCCDTGAYNKAYRCDKCGLVSNFWDRKEEKGEQK